MLVLAACHGKAAGPSLPSARHEIGAHGDFYRLPFPSDARMSGGKIDVSDFPNPAGNLLVAQTVTLAGQLEGFSTTSGIFFQLSGPIDVSRVDFASSVLDGSPIALIGADESAPDFLKRYPLAARFLADGGPYGGTNLLAILPLQGVPLLPRTRYALVIKDTLLSPSPETAALLAGKKPAGMSDDAYQSYGKAIAALQKGGLGNIGALTVFTTQDPIARLATVTAAMIAKPPAPAPFKKNEQFEGFCVYESTIDMPVYQGGEPPFDKTGGDGGLLASGVNTTGLAADGTRVFWLESTGLFSVPVAGGTTVKLGAGGAGQINFSIQSVAVDTTNVYWASNSGLFRTRKDGGGTPTLLDATVKGWAVAVDDSKVYYFTKNALVWAGK